MDLIGNLISEIKLAKEVGAPISPASKNVADFRNSRHNAIINSIQGILRRIEALNPDSGLIISRIKEAKDYDSMLELAQKLPSVVEQRVKLFVPGSVKDEVDADWKEANDCFEAGLYRSCVILCGRILEVALHAKYYQLTGVDLLEKAPGIGLGNLIAKLSDKGAFVDPGLSNQIHLINQARIHSVHKKSLPFLPSRDQAQAIMLYTKSAIEKLFEK